MISRAAQCFTAALACFPIIVLPPAVATAHARQGGVLEQIVVTVNGDIITKSEIDERLRVTRSLQEDGSDAQEPAMLTHVLRDAVDERLMMQRAAELGIEVRDDDVERVLATVKADSQVDSDEAFQALLEHEGMSLSTLRTNTRRRLVIDQVRQHLFARISVTNDEALRYFKANRRTLVHRERVAYRQFRIAVPRHGRVPEAERDRAMVKVVRARDQLANGVAFEVVAKSFSDSEGEADGGGLVGPVDLEDLEPSLNAALKTLEPGAVSMPLETAEGYAFLKLEAHQAAASDAFHENRDHIMQTLRAEKQQIALEELLARLRGAAILQWKRRDLREAYDRPFAYR